METENQKNQNISLKQGPSSFKKWTWLALFVLAALIVISGLLILQKNKKPTLELTKKPEEKKLMVTYNAAQSLPKLFPLQIPLEETGIVLNNIDSADKAQRSFISNKSVEDNFELYKAYFEKENWQVKVGTSTSSSVLKMFNAEKESLKAYVGFGTNKSGMTLVNLYFSKVK